MTYEIKPDYETASASGPIDPREILVEDEQDEDQEDLAWAIAAAYSWVSDEDED